ncbi:MAG: Dam family site-specific DNA-(adenine-N6)-methyltransferase [Planctomycetes bacterium]|nr:Dam family site-specific DNA-(adenine-N6)-methyltransferase [Planctomycetota bacterium]
MPVSGIEPFLKWPGGKRWLSSVLSAVLQAELSGTYFEPFLGAGALFLAMRPKKAVLSDVNADLIEFLKTVKRYPELVVESVWRLSNSEECYYRVRGSVPRTRIGRAARFLYLNRTCWGGVYRLNKEGRFNVPFGNSGRIICNRDDVVLASTAFRTAKLSAADFEKTMAQAGTGDVIYADPPYTTRGAGNGFIRYNESLFRWEDQLRLAKVAREAAERQAFVAVSGLNHFEFIDLYPGWWVAEFERASNVGRDLQSRVRICEVVVFSRRPNADSIVTVQIGR